MSSDVGVSRIWNRMLDAAFDNSNRYRGSFIKPSRVSRTLNRMLDAAFDKIQTGTGVHL